MKKLLTATLAVAMGATLVVTGAGCNTDNSKDEATANNAIDIIRSVHGEDAEVTNSSYKVVGVVQADGKLYDVNWTVTPDASCTVEIGEYVKLSESVDADNMYTVSVSNATVEIKYTLKASVTVGEVTKSIEFNHSVPKASGQVVTGDHAYLEINTDTATTNTGDLKVFTANGLTVTGEKHNSSTAFATGSLTRFYKGSKITIAYPGMKQIKIVTDQAYTGTNSDGSTKVDNYPVWLKTCIENAGYPATVTLDEANLTVIVDFSTPVDSLVFEATAGQLRINSVDVTAQPGGSTAQDKVNAAKDMLALDVTKYVVAGTYDLPASVGGATVTWSVKQTSEYVSISNDGKLVVGKMPASETSVVLVATIAVGTEASATKDVTIKLAPVAGVTHAGTLADPFTPSEAKAYVNAVVASDATTSTEYYVKGYVTDPGAYTSYGNFGEVRIADTADTATADSFLVYRPKPDGTIVTSTGFKVGDLVTFKGNLQNFKGNTPELVNGVTVAKEDAVDNRTPDEKAQDALDKFTVPATVTGNITIPAGITISSDDTSVIENNGTVHRPAVGASDATVKLTISATVEGATQTHTKEVTVTVKAQVAAGQSASIAFSTATNTKFEVTQVIFVNAGMTVTLDQNTSTTALNNQNYLGASGNAAQLRAYNGSKLTIAFSGINKIVFTVDTLKTSDYTAAVKSCIESAYSDATVTVNDTKVTVEFGSAVDEISFVLSAQVRFKSMDINPAD